MPNNQRTRINRPWRRNYWHTISILNARQMHAAIKWGIGMNCAWPSGALLFKTIEVQLEECTEPVVAAAQDIWHGQQRGHHSAGYTAWTSCTGDTDSISRSDGPWTEHRTVATSERVWSFTRAQMWFVPRMQARSEGGSTGSIEPPPPQPPAVHVYTCNCVVLAVNSLTFLLKYNWICTNMSYFKWKIPKIFWGGVTAPPQNHPQLVPGTAAVRRHR